MNKEKIWVNLRDSFWFLPAVYSIVSMLAVIVISLIDMWMIPQIKENIPNIFLTEKSIAKSLYAALITSILTMTTISFSTIMVVLTTYSTQFSPRTLQDFMKSQITQHVLGVYSFSFIFALINLLLLGNGQGKGLVSPFFTVIVSIICLASFIMFIHHSSRFVQVNNLIGEIRTSTSKVIAKTFDSKDYNEASEWDEQVINEWKNKNSSVILADQSGYIQGLQIKSLVEWASNNGVLLEASFYLGDYVQKGMPIFSYWCEYSEDNFSPEYSNHYVLIGNERTDIQDIEFSIQKLVEIAVKAISPSINDPHTAVNCINRIGSLLAELGSVFKPVRYYSDYDQQLRFIMEPKPYKEYLYKSFYQIRTYGSHDLAVMNSVLEALYKIAVINEEEIKEDVWRFGKYIMNVVDSKHMDVLDFEHYNKQVQKLAKACNKSIQLDHTT